MRKVMSSSWKKSRDVEAAAFQRLKDSLSDQYFFSQLIEDRGCPDFLLARKSDQLSEVEVEHHSAVQDAQTLHLLDWGSNAVYSDRSFVQRWLPSIDENLHQDHGLNLIEKFLM